MLNLLVKTKNNLYSFFNEQNYAISLHVDNVLNEILNKNE